MTWSLMKKSKFRFLILGKCSVTSWPHPSNMQNAYINAHMFGRRQPAALLDICKHTLHWPRFHFKTNSNKTASFALAFSNGQFITVWSYFITFVNDVALHGCCLVVPWRVDSHSRSSRDPPRCLSCMQYVSLHAVISRGSVSTTRAFICRPISIASLNSTHWSHSLL